MVGDDVTLPCHLRPPTDVFNEMLEWSRLDLNPRFVHMRRSGEDNLQDQNPSYMGRTSVSIEGLNKGDVSLNLSKVKLSDKGTYRCFIPRLSEQSDVQLVVETVKSPDAFSTVSSDVTVKIPPGQTKEHQDGGETVESRDKNSNSESDDSEQKPLIEKDTNTEKLKAEEETKEALDLKIPPEPLSEKSQLTHEEQLMTENKTDSVLVQIEGGVAEKEGQQDKNKDNNNDDTNRQPAIVGQTDQLPVAQTFVVKKEKDKKTKSGNTRNGEAKNYLDKEDKKKKTQPRNIDTDGTGLTQGLNGGQEAQQAAGETKDNLDQTVKTEGSEILSTETQEHQEDEDTVQSGDKSNSTSDDSEQVTPTATDTNTEALDEAKCSIKEERQNDKTKEKNTEGQNTEGQNTTHIPGDTKSQPVTDGQTDQLPATQTSMKDEDKDTVKSGDKSNSTSDDSEQVTPTATDTNTEALDEAKCSTKEERQDDKNKDKNTEGQNTTHIQGDKKSQPVTDGQTDQLPATQTSMKDEDKETESGHTGAEDQIAGETEDNPKLTGSEGSNVSHPAYEGQQENNGHKNKNEHNLDKEDEKQKTQPKSNDTKGQGLNVKQEAEQAAEEKKEHLDQTGKSEEKGSQQTDKEKTNVCEGQGGENVIPKNEKENLQSPNDRQTNQLSVTNNSTEVNSPIPEGTQQDVAKTEYQLSTEETRTQNDADTSQGENVTSN
ncbi:clumping factor A-like [Scomber japonicus]|uniref:clumping factor A-like n=1 Tax=Scomber japonicus TaxID=13676 RepID=UPI00230680F1|nr:clumping factor A-like [Scomber japonicus]